jgi:predicted lipoprotein with Yx(FWY)xxD motif
MPLFRSRVFFAVALGALVVLALTSGSARSQSAAGAVVRVHATSLGKVLVTANGRVLYLYTPDHRNTSACYGECASLWPPLLTTGKPRAGAGAKSALLGIAMRKDGKHQVTYAGHPLYLFAGDKKSSQTNGQGLQKVWWVVSPAGLKITKRPVVSTPAPAAVTLQLSTTNLGQVITDANGRTVYLYTPDTTTASTCYGQCAATWPPVLVIGAPVAGDGLASSLLGTTTRTDGTVQVTYGGHPLYLFAKDAKAGDTNGEAVFGVWYAVSSSGGKI